MEFTADIVVVGTGVAGLYAALNLPQDKEVIIIQQNNLQFQEV